MKIYQIWIYDKDHYEMRFASRSIIATLFALWKFDKCWKNFKLIKRGM